MGTNLAQRVASNAVAQQEAPTMAQVIARLQPELARALPVHLNADRMARLALTCIRKDLALAECSPESFAGALLTAAALGLEVGVSGEAYLVAYKKECTLIVGYQGMAKLFYQHPMAQYLDTQTVYSNDEFDYAYGLDPFLRHKPFLGDVRGSIVAYYAVAKLTTGASAFVVLSPEEVKKLRNGNVGPSGRIPDPQRWMERKTALRQLVKLLPKSTQLVQALAVDEKAGRELQAELIAQRQQIEAPAPAGVNRATGEAGPAYQQGGPVGGEISYMDPNPEDDAWVAGKS